MKRMKKHKSKQVKTETSTSRLRGNEEHDLAYFIHDRVELIQQAFSVIRTKELKAMVPQCVKNLSLDDLKELCTEELLGISSKRLCAILDGAEAPSDTESSSSSPEQMETISLDSISSDEEILSQTSSKNKKHKHNKRKSKNKHKRQDTKKKDKNEGTGGTGSTGEEKSHAARAGLTMLELLELQARARAIRAQLQKDQLQNKAPETAKASATGESDDEVEIKEEPAEVVEISSEDEKPNVEQLKAHLVRKSPEAIKEQDNPRTITKRINDLVITVPQTKQTRKIKLNRNKVVSCEMPKATISTNISPENKKEVNQNTSTNETIKVKGPKKNKSKKKEKNKQTVNKKDGSDHDEITLQLSDTEKMDLLEDLDRKNYDSVSSSSKKSEDSSDSDNSVNSSNNASHKDVPVSHPEIENKLQTIDITIISTDENISDTDKTETNTIETVNSNEIIITDEDMNNFNDRTHCNENLANVDEVPKRNDEKLLEASEVTKDTDKLTDNVSLSKTDIKNVENTTESADINVEECKLESKKRKLSEGEILDEAISYDISEIVSVSNDDKTKMKKKSKKKSKKCNDEKKANKSETKNDTNIEMLFINDDDVYEILELSDSSSCYEVEGVSLLSKEPTTVEIEALSAKVDDTIREDITDDVEEYEQSEQSCIDKNISWKDRYLESKKVKCVLKTSNILNAIRKKNKELKKKLEEAKKLTPVEKGKLEGTIDEYNTLESSTKYVDPVLDKSNEEEEQVMEVTKEMEKDAKQLLKMYKKLLKYNDMNKKKDPNQKKVKKSKKKKQKHKDKEASKAAASDNVKIFHTVTEM